MLEKIVYHPRGWVLICSPGCRNCVTDRTGPWAMDPFALDFAPHRVPCEKCGLPVLEDRDIAILQVLSETGGEMAVYQYLLRMADRDNAVNEIEVFFDIEPAHLVIRGRGADTPISQKWWCSLEADREKTSRTQAFSSRDPWEAFAHLTRFDYMGAAPKILYGQTPEH